MKYVRIDSFHNSYESIIAIVTRNFRRQQVLHITMVRTKHFKKPLEANGAYPRVPRRQIHANFNAICERAQSMVEFRYQCRIMTLRKPGLRNGAKPHKCA